MSHKLQGVSIQSVQDYLPSLHARTKDDAKFYPVVRLQFCSSGQCGVTHRCNNFQIHADPKKKFLLGSHL